MSALDASYEDPLAIEPAWLCHLNLVFAIGLLLATPPPGSEDAEVIARLRDHHKDLDEQFYLNAKSVNDPLTGFEDADFWSTQALLLMAVYMLTKSKRNTAFALLGMAVRSAYALGLHREDTLVVFNPDEQEARRNLWKSLFVMDRYLALSLGRPSAIFDDTLYNSSTKISTNGSRHNSYSDSPSFEESSTYSIDAAVKSCSTVGKILKEVYQQRKISTKLAHEIAQQCREFPHKIAPILHCWPKFVAKSPAHGISVLHVNLFWIHSAMLLTRPFFLFVLNFEISRCITPSAPTQVRRGFRRIEKFSEVCISSATHTVSLVKAVYSAGYLPRRNPWVIYFLASAAFVLLANEIIPLHRHHAAQDSIRDALDIMAYCGVDDTQAERLHYILNTFREAVEDERSKRSGNVNQLAPVQSKHQTVDSILGPMSISNQDPSLPLPQPVPTATSFTQPYFSQPTSTTSYQPMPQSSQSASSPAAPSFMTNQQPPGKSSSSTPAPLEPLPPPSVPPNPLSPASASRTMPTAGGPLDPLNPNLPFANLLDFASFGGPGDATSSMYGSATGGTGHAGTSGASDTDFGPDENIDFEAFWTWPTTTTGANEGSADGAGLMPGSMHSNQSMYGTQMV
jgi:Fungal specific transcription factor domain